MTQRETIPEDDCFGLDALLAGIRTRGRWWAKEQGDPFWLGDCLEPLIHPPPAFAPPAPWFRWCRYSERQASVEHWLGLSDPLQPLREVAEKWAKPSYSPLVDHNNDWIAAALRLAKLAREASDVAHTGLTPEETAGFDAIVTRYPMLPRAALWDLYCWYRDLPRQPRSELCLALPLVDPETQRGVLGELRLALMPQGSGTLYRAHTLAFVGMGEDFQGAIAAAQAALAPAGLIIPPDQDLRWEVRRRATGAIPQALDGASCGGAFGLGLRLLLAGTPADPRHGALGPLRPEELSGIAITATVNAAGKLGPIKGEIAKLQATAKDRLRPLIHTFLVHTDQKNLDAALAHPHEDLRLLRAENLNEALDRILEDRLSRRAYLAALAGFDHRLWLAQDYPQLIGREWLRDELDQFLASPHQQSGYLLLSAGPGVGKTAFLLHQIDAEPKPDAWHFIRQGQGDWDDPERFLAALEAQLRLRFRLLPLPEAATKSPAGRFQATLEALSRDRLEDGEHCLILLDGLDEAFGPTGRWPREVLPGLLPPTLPRGIYIVLSSRPGEHLRWLGDARRVHQLHLDPEHAALWQHQEADLRQYIAWRAREILLQLGLELSETFQGQLLAATQGLFIAAERFLNRADPQELASDLRTWMADPATLPRGLDRWLQHQWLRLEAKSREQHHDPEVLRLLLGLLACAREPLTKAHLQSWYRAGARMGDPCPVPSPTHLGWLATDRLFAAPWHELLALAREWFGNDFDQGRYRFLHTGFLQFCRDRLDGSEQLDLNQLLAHWAWGWPSQAGEVRGYALRYLPDHLCAAQQWNALHSLLTDPAAYLPARIALAGEAGWPALMSDYQRALTHWPGERAEQRRELDDVHRVLSQAGHRLACGREPVIQVLYNALTGIWGEETSLGQRLREAADAARMPWFRLLNPPKQLAPLLRIFAGHWGVVHCVKFSPLDAQGRSIIAVGGQDGTLRLWDPGTGACLQVMDGHADQIKTLAFSPPDADGGFLLATGSRDGTALLWDPATGACLHVLAGHTSEINALAFSAPDAQGYCLLATGSRDGTARIWEPSTGACLQVLKGHSPRIKALAFSRPDTAGRCLLATGSSDGTVRICEPSTGACLRVLRGHSNEIRSLGFSSPDASGHGVLATASKDRIARIWDPATGACLQVLQGHTRAINALAFGPPDAEGRRVLATGSGDFAIRTWDPATGVCLQVLKGHSLRIEALAFSQSDSRGRCLLATASEDTTARVWDPGTGKCLQVLAGHSSAINTLAFSPRDVQGRCLLATGSRDGTARIWEPAKQAPPRVPEDSAGRIRNLAFSPPVRDGRRWFATGSSDGTARLWDPATGSCLKVLAGHTSEIKALTFSTPDAEGYCLLATGSKDGTVRIWDPVAAACLQVLELDWNFNWIRALTFISRDAEGRCLLATASRDGTARIWDPANGVFLRELKGQSKGIGMLAASPPDAAGCCLLATVEGRTILLWDPGTGKCLHVLRGHSNEIRALTFAPSDADNRLRLATGSKDHTVRIWDPATGACLQVMKGHSSGIVTLAFSSSDREGYCWLATGSWDFTVRIWDVTTGQQLVEIPALRPFRDLLFDSTGRFLTIVQDTALEIWDWRSRDRVASVALDNLEMARLDLADPCRLVAACIDMVNRRPTFHHLRLENLSLL